MMRSSDPMTAPPTCPSAVLQNALAAGILPVIVADDPAIGVELAHALQAGGIPSAEVTLRTPNALKLLTAMRVAGILVGAGTVLDGGQAKAAIDAGALFLVSPGYSDEVNVVAAQAGVPMLPGVATATEMMRARADGFAIVKYFPAAANGGPGALAALAAPLGNLRFVPTGGVTEQTAPSWLALDSVAAVGGSWMVARDLLGVGDLEGVTELARRAVALRVAG